MLVERLAELELALDDQDWLKLSIEGDRDLSRDGIKKIARLARLMFLKNPLINRGILVQSYYIWGQGVSIQARDEDVNAVVQAFIDDPGNRRVMFGHQARTMKEITLEIEGNLFFALFTNPATGRVQLRTFPADEISEIITNPDDREEVWYYRRTWQQGTLDSSGNRQWKSVSAFYPDWQYHPSARVAKFGSTPIMWTVPVKHVKIGGLDDMTWGVSDVYCSLDWAKAYKSFLEDWASIVRSLQRFAWRLSTKGGKKGVADAKTKMASTLSTDMNDTNPAPTTGSVFVAGEGVDMTPMPKTGATISAEDGRQMRLMAASGMGIPDTILSGDSDMGNLATAKTLDRPTELQMMDRQALWQEVISDLCGYAIDRSALSPGGELDGSVQLVHGVPTVVLASNANKTVDVVFPPILEHDIKEIVGSIVSAATLDGKPTSGLVPKLTITKLLLSALNVENADELLEKMFDEDGELIGDLTPLAAVTPLIPPTEAVDQMMTEAVREIQTAIREHKNAQSAS